MSNEGMPVVALLHSSIIHMLNEYEIPKYQRL